MLGRASYSYVLRTYIRRCATPEQMLCLWGRFGTGRGVWLQAAAAALSYA